MTAPEDEADAGASSAAGAQASGSAGSPRPDDGPAEPAWRALEQETLGLWGDALASGLGPSETLGRFWVSADSVALDGLATSADPGLPEPEERTLIQPRGRLAAGTGPARPDTETIDVPPDAEESGTETLLGEADGSGDSIAPHDLVSLRVLGLPGPESVADLNDFEVAEQLGAGGMGEVYRAEQKALRRNVALKVITPRYAREPEVEARFVDEAIVTGQLEHPSIVTVHQLGRTPDQRLVLCMREVRGESLRAHLDREPATTPERLRRYLDALIKVSDAIAYAHSEGVLHRDLKPSNVMVGAFGEVQVMDWGLALRLDGKRKPRGVCGTPAYMPPEQARDYVETFGPPLDVFGLGGLLYAILTDEPPYWGEGTLQILAQAALGEVEDPRLRRPERDLPGDLVDVCMRALAKRIEDRTPSASAFREELERYLVHADALRLIERAQGRLERAPENESPLARAQRLEGVDALLTQARELWPESAEAAELARETRIQRADVALDRDDPQGALALLTEAAPLAERPRSQGESSERVGPGSGEGLGSQGAASASSEARAHESRAGSLAPEDASPRDAATRELAPLGLGLETDPRAIELRAAARRQVGLWRQKVGAALVLGLLIVGGWLGWQSEVARAEALTGERSRARARTGRAVEAAWRRVAEQDTAEHQGETLAALRKTAELAGWNADYPWLRLASTWEALRAGNRSLAATHLAEVLPAGPRGVFVDLRAKVLAGASPLEAAATWQRASAGAPPGVSVAGEAVLLSSGSPGNESRERAAYERLLALGAFGPLLDPRASTPTPWIPEGIPRLRRVLDKRSQRGYLLALDPRTGAERWRYPRETRLQRLRPDSLSPPLLVASPEGPRVALALVSEVVFLDPADGRVRQRLRARGMVGALLPSGRPDGLLVVQRPAPRGLTDGRARAIAVDMHPSGAYTWRARPGAAAGSTTSFPWTELLANVEHGLGGPWPVVRPLGARRQLENVQQARVWDPTAPLLALPEARLRWVLGERKEARRLVEEDLCEGDLSAREFALCAQALASLAVAFRDPSRELFAVPNLDTGELPLPLAEAKAARQRGAGDLWTLVDRLLEQAVRAQVARGVNPGTSKNLGSAPANVARIVARTAFAADEPERAVRYLQHGRLLSTHLEGDAVFLPWEERWLRSQSLDTTWLEPYRPGFELHGATLIPHGLLQLADAAQVLVAVVPWVLLLISLSLIARSHAERTQTLHDLGFRSRGARWLAFATHPFLRSSWTFVAFATRAERALLVGGGALVAVAFVSLSAIEAHAQRAESLPREVLSGDLSHPAASGFLRARAAAAEERAEALACARLLVEGAVQGRNFEEVEAALTRLPTDDGYAVAVRAWLADARGEAGAPSRYGRLVDEADYEAVARLNLSRIAGTPLPAEESFPLAYRAASRLAPRERLAPLAQDADLRLALGLPNDLRGLLAQHTRDARAGTTPWINLDAYERVARATFGEGGPTRAVAVVSASALVPLLALALFGLLHLPFGSATPSLDANTERRLGRLGGALDLLWPGVGWIARGHTLRGAACALSVPLLLALGHVARNGSGLVRRGLEQANAFRYMDGGRFDVTQLITPQERFVGALAWFCVVVIYVLTWLTAARRVARARRALPDSA